MSNTWDKRRARWSAYKKMNKGIPAAVVVNSGLNSHASALKVAEPFGEILDSWRKAVVPQSQPKPYEAKGRCGTMAAAKLAVGEAKNATPVHLWTCFQATIEEFDGGYDWDWQMVREHPKVSSVDRLENGQWVSRRTVWNEATQRYEYEQ